jgi:hypothetical protein
VLVLSLTGCDPDRTRLIFEIPSYPHGFVSLAGVLFVVRADCGGFLNTRAS